MGIESIINPSTGNLDKIGKSASDISGDDLKYLQDAPSDDVIYGRKNGAWVEAAGAAALLLDQSTPQTVTGGVPIFDVGIQANGTISVYTYASTGFLYQRTYTGALTILRVNDGSGNQNFGLSYGGTTAGIYNQRWYLTGYKLGLIGYNGGDILLDAVTNKGSFSAGNFEGYFNNYDLKLADAAGACYVNVRDSGDNIVAWINSDGAAKFNSDVDIDGVLDWSANPCLPKIYSQADEPDIPNNSMAFWKDTDDSKYYLILDIGGTQKKIELI